MIIHNQEYEVKPCPFCQKLDQLTITSIEGFGALYAEDGKATIRLSCERCRVDMYEHDYDGPIYDKKVKKLVNKWNHREEENDGIYTA